MDNFAGRILVVDDEPPLLRMMELYLNRLGYTVTVAASTAEAWSEVEAAAGFDVVVLDATMAGPDLEGFALRMCRTNPALRVLVTSGYPVDLSGLGSAVPNRTQFLHKPFTPEMLATTIRRMLGTQEENL